MRRRPLDDKRGECKVKLAREPFADVAQAFHSTLDTASTPCFIKRRDHVSLPPVAAQIQEARRAGRVIAEAIKHRHLP